MSEIKVTDGAPIDERELQRLIKDWRSGRATRNIFEAISDAYVAVFAAVMVGAMAANVLLKAQTVAASCDQLGCQSARSYLPWAVFALCLAVALGVARLFGPVLASAAEGFWLLDAPLKRSRILRKRLVAAVLLSFAFGAVVGALITLLTGAEPMAIIAWAAATGLGCSGLVAWAAAEQGVDRTLATRVVARIAATVAFLALLLVVGVAANWFFVEVPESANLLIAGAVGALGLLLLLGAIVLANARLNQMSRTRLVSGGSLVKGLSGAFYALDLGLAHDIVVAREAIERGHVKSQRGGGSGISALRWRELQRIRRAPRPLFTVAATIIVPYAADALGMATLAPFLGALVLWLALIPLMGGLRVLTRTSGLARCFPFSTVQLRSAAITGPLVVGVVWALATIPAFVGFGDGVAKRDLFQAVLVAVVTAGAGVLGAMRWTTAKQIDFGKPMVATQAGAFPPGLMANLFKGLDMVLIITAPVMLGWSPVISFAIGGIATVVLLGSFNMDELKAQEQRQKRAMVQQKSARGAATTTTKQNQPTSQSKAARAQEQEIAKLTNKKKKSNPKGKQPQNKQDQFKQGQGKKR